MALWRSNQSLRNRPASMPTDSGDGRGRWRRIENGGGQAGGGALKTFRVSAKAGTDAPFAYSLIEVKRNGTSWDDVSGGDTYDWTGLNAYEQNGSGGGGNPVEVGDIVMGTKIAGGLLFERSAYKGTY